MEAFHIHFREKKSQTQKRLALCVKYARIHSQIHTHTHKQTNKYNCTIHTYIHKYNVRTFLEVAPLAIL